MGTAMETRITMIVITTMSSTKVKPRRRRRLPLCIRSSTGILIHGFAVDVKDTLAAPTLTLRVVLIAAHAPLGLPGERVQRNAAEEAHLLSIGPRQLHAFHQDIEGFGPVIGAELLRAQ